MKTINTDYKRRIWNLEAKLYSRNCSLITHHLLSLWLHLPVVHITLEGHTSCDYPVNNDTSKDCNLSWRLVGDKGKYRRCTMAKRALHDRVQITPVLFKNSLVWGTHTSKEFQNNEHQLTNCAKLILCSCLLAFTDFHSVQSLVY